MTGYPPVVGWSASITTGWPSCGTWIAPATSPSLANSSVDQAPYRRRPSRRSPTRLTVSTVHSLAVSCADAAASNQLARGPGPHPEAIGPRRRRRDVDDDRGRRVVADGQQHSRPDRRRPETRQRVVRARPEHRRDRESPAHGQVRPGAFVVDGDRQLLARPSERGVPARRSSRRGPVRWHAPRARRLSRAPRQRSSLPTRRLTSAASAGSTAPAVGTPRWARPGRPRSWIVVDQPMSTTSIARPVMWRRT